MDFSQMRLSREPAVYRTEPLVVPGISGYLPEKARGGKDPFAPVVEKESRVVVPTREVTCYECGKKSRIPVAALSAHCVHCCAHLTLTDYRLMPGSKRLTRRTLGEVVLPAQTELSLLSIVSGRMVVAGKATGVKLRVMDVLEMEGKAVLEGQVQAGRLEVKKGARVQVSPGLSVESAEIKGMLTARLHATGCVHVRDGGALVGDCHAPDLRLEPGAVHRGTWYPIKS